MKWNDNRKGMCEATDSNIYKIEGKSCIHYVPRKYKRLRRVVMNLIKGLVVNG